MPRLLVFALSIATAQCALTASASAQSVRDKVKDHVGKELDDKGNDKRDRTRSDRSGSASPRSQRQVQGEKVDLGTLVDPELANPSEKLPRRILPDTLRLNLKLDAAYRGWLAQQYHSADVDLASFATWRLSVRGKFFKYLSLHRGYYESTGLSTPRNQAASVATLAGKHAPKGAKALAYIGFPFMKTWQPIIRYEAQSFNTTATPKIPLCIVDRKKNTDTADCPKTLQKLQMTSAYETFVVGIRYNSDNPSHSYFATSKGKSPPLYMGLGLLSYNKPYQVTVDGNTLEDFLFDGQFQGAGLAFGGEFGGGARRYFGRIDMQVGLGEVSLTDDLTLNEIAPDDWLIGYVQGNLSFGHRFVLHKGPPTVYFRPMVSAGGASFHFVNNSASGDGDDSAPGLNWDFLWSARAAIEIAL